MQARMHLFKSKSIDCNLELRDPFIPSILVILKNDQNLVHNIDYFKKRFNAKENLILNQFKKIQSKKISLFGCGDGMEYLLSIIKLKNIRFLIDNNKMLEGSSFRGKKISGPTIISKLGTSDIVFITALNIKNVLTIKKQIRRLNKQVKILS